MIVERTHGNRENIRDHGPENVPMTQDVQVDERL